MPDILLYTDIYSYSSAEFIRQLDAVTGEEVTVRVNTDGGDPQYAWGMISKFIEFQGKKLIKVDGKARSMGAYFLCYVDDAECLDISEFVLHRAAAASWIENDPEQMKLYGPFLDQINKYLRAGLEAKIDVAKLKELKGVTMNQLFSMDGRVEITLNAKEAKQIGLVNRIVSITPAKKKEIKALEMRAAAQYIPSEAEKEIPAQPPTNTPKKMDLNTLRTEHPEVFAQAVAIGTAQEKDRTGAWLAFASVDLEAVAKGIKDGETLSQTSMAELSLKALGKTTLQKIESASAGKIETTEEPAAAAAGEKPEVTAFKASLQTAIKPAV